MCYEVSVLGMWGGEETSSGLTSVSIEVEILESSILVLVFHRGAWPDSFSRPKTLELPLRWNPRCKIVKRRTLASLHHQRSTIAPEGSVKADSQQRVAIKWESWLTRIDQLDWRWRRHRRHHSQDARSLMFDTNSWQLNKSLRKFSLLTRQLNPLGWLCSCYQHIFFSRKLQIIDTEKPVDNEKRLDAN
jgi:hypothetical protein